MKVKYCLITFLLLTLLFSSNAQTKSDTVRKVSWAIKLGGGVNMLRQKESYKDGGQNYTYYTKPIDGTITQLGIKLNTMPRKVLSLTSELNYIVSQYRLIYKGVESGQGSSTSYEANYSVTSHSIQFAVLPKITIGPKKIIYISFGLFGGKPFYFNTKGSMTVGKTSGASSVIKVEKDNEIKTDFNVNFGAIADVGLDIPIKKQKLSIELRLQPGLSNFIRNTSLKSYSVLFSAAYTIGKTNAIIQFNTD